ncbi:MAG: hypothetical protein ACQEVA_04620 [Myxococcota bacterium]
MSENEQSETREERVKRRTETFVRRLGYVVFMGGGLLIFIPMLIGVGSGISEGEVWDPYTNEPVEVTSPATDCKEDARRLLKSSNEMDGLEPAWDEPYRAWITRCKGDYPTLYDLLQTTRQELRKKKKNAQ